MPLPPPPPVGDATLLPPTAAPTTLVAGAIVKAAWEARREISAAAVYAAFLEIMGNTPRERVEIEVWALDNAQLDFLKG